MVLEIRAGVGGEEAALFAETIGKTKEAVTLFKKIKTDYPLSEKANDVERYLARLGSFSE